MTSLARSFRLALSFALLAATVASAFPQATYATTANAPAAQTSPFTWVFQGAAPELFAQQDLVNVAADQEPVSGSVVAIAPSPTDANLVYVAGVNGGVWKTTNATATDPIWTPLTDNLKSLSIGALALDAGDTTGRTVIAGTGRYSGFASRGDDTVGVYYTTDGGATWTVTTDPQLSANSISGVAAHGSVLMAASAGGLFRSQDTGATWTKISGVDVLPNAPALVIAADPANAGRFYATFGGAGGGIFRTNDDGASWSNVTPGISGIAASTSCFTAAVSPLGSVYALFNGAAATDPRGLYRSATGGASWTALDLPPGSYTCTNSASSVALSADKTNDALVYIATYESPIYRLDASKPAAQLPSQQYAVIGDVNATNAALNYGKPHPDNAALAYDASGGLLASNHGGLFRLDSPGAPASATNVWTSLNGNLGVSEIHDIAYDTVANVLVGGYQDNGVAYQTGPGSTAWTRQLSAGDGGDVAVDDVSLATVGASAPQASSPLGAAATSTATSLRVVSTAVFPPGGTYNVLVDNEQMFVTGVASLGFGGASASQTGNTVTITLSGHSLVVGQVVTISGFSVTGYNGAVTIASVPSSSTFTYTTAATGLASATGGSVFFSVLSVTRGANGTTPAAHSAGAVVSSVAPSQPLSLRYASAQNLSNFTRYSFNAANTLLAKGVLSTSVMDDKQFTTPVVVNAIDAKRLLVGGSLRAYESLDRGTSFSSIFPAGATTVGVNANANQAPLVYGGVVNGVSNPDLIYLGSGNKVYKRTQAGGAVTPLADLPAGAGTVSDIVVSPADANQVFVVDSDQVFASTNGGASWSDVTGGLFNSLSSGVIVPLAYVSGPAPYIAVGTRSGVYASLVANLGSWVKLGDGLPDVPVYDIEYEAGDDVLAIATLGRAAWKLANASAAFTPANVAPSLALTGPAAANEGTTQYSYSFTVSDPGDRFTVNGPTISGGSLVAGSLVTTGSGGSFKVTFADGPSTASVGLQVTDSSGLTSNVAATSVTVANAAPAAAILGAPTSGSPGTTINLTGSVTDPSAVDQTAGFVYDWLVQKTVGASTTNFATGSAATFSYTPDVAGTYKVFFRAKDKDGLFSGYTAKTITAASPDLTEANVSLTVGEGIAAVNSGTYAHHGPAPLAISASTGTVTQNDGENPRYSNITTVAVPGSAVPWLVASNPSFTAQQINQSAPVVVSSINGVNISGGRWVQITYLSGGLDLGGGGFFHANGAAGQPLGAGYVGGYVAGPTPNIGALIGVFTDNAGVIIGTPFFVGNGPTSVQAPAGATQLQLGVNDGNYGDNSGAWTIAVATSLNVRGYWQLGEDDASAAGGATGNATTAGQDANGLKPALNLTRQGSPSYTAVDGSNGSVLAMSFNGSTDSYTLASPVTTATDNFGVEARVKPTNASDLQIVIYNGNTSTSGFGIFIQSGNYFGLYGLNAAFDTGVAATTGVWQDLALVRDGGISKFYLDGALVYSANVGGPNPATSGFAVGQAPQVAGQFFNGAVDDARVFTFAPGTFDPADLGANTSVAGTWSWSYATDDGPAQSQNVTITASTGVSGDASSISFPLTVDNSAPTAALSNSGPVSEGHSATVSFADQSDPSTADTTAGFRYAYDFDNDGVYDVGDGSYAGSSANASAAAPASLLAEGPGARVVSARIIDKDGGYSDYATSVSIDNAPPSASASGQATALVDQQVTFVLSATDASAADQAAGFTYTVSWGDGTSETVGPAIGTGDATARHAFQAAGPYSIQVTATDQNGATSAPATAAIQVNPLTTASLQSLLATSAGVVLAPGSDANLQSDVAAVNGLSATASPVDITIILKGQPYGGVTLGPPAGVALNLAGNDTTDIVGTQLFSPSGPAVTVTRGEVFVQGAALATSADAPTILMLGGHLTLGQNLIEESSGFNNAAIEIRGGVVDYGFDVITNVNGDGSFFRTPSRQSIRFPQGIDDFLIPNMFAVNGVMLPASHRSATSLTASPAGSSAQGQAVTFTAVVDTNVAVLGYATGSVSFYDGATLMATAPLQIVGGQATATTTTSSLSTGSHTIKAVYSGDNLFFSTEAALSYQVAPNTAPVAANDSYTTLANTTLTVSAPGVLSNDTDADGNPLTAVKVTNPAHGTLTLNANGSFTYTPAAGYVGSDSFTYKANDGTADSNVATVSIAVRYSFTGFFQPVDNLPIENQVKAGQGIPVKFSLGGNFGLGILAAGSPTSQVVACAAGVPIDDIETTTTSNSGLSYDAASGQYTYVWKTDKAWANTCRQFNLKLTDGKTYTALFKFTK